MYDFDWGGVILIALFFIMIVLMAFFRGETADREVKMKAQVQIEQEKTEQMRLELEILKTKENLK